MVTWLLLGAGKLLFKAKSAATAARSCWSGLSPSTRKWIIGGILIVAGFFLHQHFAHKAVKEADQAGYDRAKAEDKATRAKVKAMADQLRQSAERMSQSIANQGRTKHEGNLRRHAGDAVALLVRGPGAAAVNCRPVDHPGLSAGAGRHEQPAPERDAPGPEVPAGDRAVVSWSWLVKRAQEHDDLLSEVMTWRTTDAQQRSAWEQMRTAETPKEDRDGTDK